VEAVPPESQNPHQAALRPYAQPSLPKSLLDLATSAVPYLVLTTLMAVLVDAHPWLVLALGVPAAGFLLRTYIVFHDCSHGSFLPTKRANALLGIPLGLLVWSPFASWRHNHAVHHATAGDLDRRGVGDLPTLTVAEYHAKDRRGRLGYRIFRNPLAMFTVGPIVSLIIIPRLTSHTDRPRIRRSIHATNLALLVLHGGLIWLLGPLDWLLVLGPATLLAGAAGVFLFYVQHQFEDVYWEDSASWSYADAALRGSSHLVLPKVLQFFTGNIGLHHVHHLNARIPNYNLQRAHDENPVFHDVPTLTFWDGVRATRLKLWCPERRRLVTFAEARRDPARAGSPAPAPVLAET
jgi:acyl-lipid omega-6 desaturase (Delta-12 desaturase)